MKFLSLAVIASLTYYGFVEKGPHTHGRIGILYEPVRHKVIRVYRNSPAARAKLRKGDIVKYINDVDICGPSYTTVNLTVMRGSEILHFEIERIPDKLIDVRHEDKPEIP